MAGSGHTSSDIWEGVGQGVCLSPLLGLVRVCVRACVCVCACVCELLSHVRLFATDPMDCSLPGSPIHGILQASTGVGCRFLLRLTNVVIHYYYQLTNVPIIKSYCYIFVYICLLL